MIKEKHAIYSPSSAHRWMACAPSVALSEGEPNTSSKYALEGTAAHELAAKCLTDNQSAFEFIGVVINVKGTPWAVDEEMAENVQKYVDEIRSYPAKETHIETKLSLEWITGEKGAEGTADAIIIEEGNDFVRIRVCDLKYGVGVEVDAKENPQLMLYALAAVKAFKDLLKTYPTFDVVLEIHQPRISDKPSRWDVDPARLVAFGKEVKAAVKKAEAIRADFKAGEKLEPDHYAPGEKNCKFCKAKVKCPARLEIVKQTGAAVNLPAVSFDPLPAESKSSLLAVTDETSDDQLATYMLWVDTIEDWCKGVRDKVMARMLSGETIPGFKLVQGRKGQRKWSSEEQVDEYMKKTMRLTQDERYKMKVISPAEAEKRFAKESPTQWKRLNEFITQEDGKPKLALASEKGVEYKPAQVEFIDEELVEKYL